MKFSQTNDTLAIKGQLAEELGFIGDSEVCSQILDRNCIPPANTDKYTKVCLRALKKPTSLMNTPKVSISTA